MDLFQLLAVELEPLVVMGVDERQRVTLEGGDEIGHV